MPNKRIIVVGLSDTHAGHKLGLCNPDVKLKEIVGDQPIEYSPQLLEVQKWLWEVYSWGMQQIISLAAGDDIVLIHNGDPTHGKASFLELMSSRMSDQPFIARANIEPWLHYDNVRAVRFAVGTGVHEMGEGSSSLIVAELLSKQFPNVNISVVYHGLINIDGFIIDFAHHGPGMGSRKWLEGNELRYYLRSLVISEIMSGKVPPHLVLRGHYHTYKREFLETSVGGKFYENWIALLPGFTFKDDYTRRVTRSEFKQGAGMIAFELISGHLYRTHPFIKVVDIRTKEVI
jgi:hypothetical protein